MKKWICVVFKLKNDNRRYSIVTSFKGEIIDVYEEIKTYLINKYGDDFMGIESYNLYIEE